jgi:hypothetical protein
MSKHSLARLAVAAVFTPLLMLGFAGAASAAEITPIAEYVDTTVSDLESEIGGALDALGLAAE